MYDIIFMFSEFNILIINSSDSYRNIELLNMDTVPDAEEISTAEISREMEASVEGETINSTTGTTVKTKRGPPVHSIWRHAFGDPYAFSKSNPNNAICKNCKQSVRHHHKLLSVKTHLKKCKEFKKLMLDTPVADRPEWWNEMTNYKKGNSSSLSSASSTSTRWHCSFTTLAQVS